MASKRETETTKAIDDAKGIIRTLPEGCGYAFCITDDCTPQNPAEMEIFPRDMEEYDKVRHTWRYPPVRVPEEFQWARGIMRVVIYKPEAWAGE